MSVNQLNVGIAPDITEELEREDYPVFRRIYRSKIDDRCRVTIKARTTMFRERDLDGELTQTNGRWVLFDPRAIADKILDPVLVPKIQAVVDRVRIIDAEFLRSGTSEFTDRGGARWVRQQGKDKRWWE